LTCLVWLFASAGAGQTPDPVTLIKEVQAHQSKLDEIRENYTYHSVVRTETLDGNGKNKETTTEEYEVFFVNGHRIQKLVRKDGVALNAKEQEREQKRVQKEVEQDLKKPATGRGTAAARSSFINDMLAVAKASNQRRVVLRDRPTLVFDFAGDPGAHAQSMEQKAEKKLAGTVWIDEAERQVARIEVRFYDNYSIGGGLLVKVQKGTEINVDQAPQGDGLWMETVADSHIAARLVVKNFRENIRIQNFDFRKFDIGTVQQIQAPAHKD
jgi:hypothetical protein